MFGACSAWLTLTIALERYLYVCRQPIAKSICKPLYTKIGVSCILISAVFMNMPYFFYWDISEGGNIMYTDFALSANGFIFSWIRMVIVKVIPIILVSICNVALLVKVYKTNKKTRSQILPSFSIHHQKHHQNQTKLTAMLLSITFVFVVCNTTEPMMHSGIYAAIFGECSIYNESYEIFRMVTNILEVVSWASNFLSYVVFNRHYVDMLKYIICYFSIERRKRRTSTKMIDITTTGT